MSRTRTTPKKRTPDKTRARASSGVRVSSKALPARQSAAQAARARRAAQVALERQEREAQEWFSRRPTLDHGAVGRCASWQAMVERWADWQADRSLHHWPRAGIVRFRCQRTGDACTSACLLCERPPNDLLWESQLRAVRPGTDHPLSACGSTPADPVEPAPACLFSYAGELEADRSLVAAFAPRDGLVELHARNRARALLEREAVTRRRRIEGGLRAAQARRKGVA